MASVVLTWNANPATDNVTGYEIWGANGTSVAIGSCTKLATVAALTWTDTGLPNSQARTYYIRARNTIGPSTAEGPINVTTAAASTYLLVADNLSDLASTSAARANLGLSIGTDVHAQAPSVQAVTSSATVTPTFSDDGVKVTAQAVSLTLANPSGTVTSMWGWAIRIKDNGTARSISFGTQYRPIGVTLPTTTVIGKTLYLGAIWNNDDSKVDVVAVAQEA